jgi:hypothetical protein
MNLNRLRKQGVVVARYVADGCNVELELLPNCIARGQYDYEPYAAADSKVITSKQELFADLPLGAARFARELAERRVLRTDYMLVGMVALPPKAVVMATDLQGPGCSRATHVVSRVYLGGFGMASGEEHAIGTVANVFSASADQSLGAAAARVATEGNVEDCQEAYRTGREQAMCSVPLRVGLLALQGRGQSVCKPGLVWDGARCVSSDGARAPRSSYEYGDDAPCRGHGNVLYLEGEPLNPIHPGRLWLLDGVFSQKPDPRRVQLGIATSEDRWLRSSWRLLFSSQQMRIDLREGEYEGALSAPRDDHPQFDIYGPLAGSCSSKVGGKFEVLELEWSGDLVKRFTAVFEHPCRAAPSRAAIRGCVHYEAPF